MQTIHNLTGITPDDRNQMIYDNGLMYLKHLIPPMMAGDTDGLPDLAHEISSHRKFWAWWVYHWETRDLIFIESVKQSPIGKNVAQQIYQDLHDPIKLHSELYLNGSVLQDSYAKMIGEMRDEIVNA